MKLWITTTGITTALAGAALFSAWAPIPPQAAGEASGPAVSAVAPAAAARDAQPVAAGAPLPITFAMTLTGSGKILHVHTGPQPGDKPFKSSVKSKDVAPCIEGTAAGCTDGVTIFADAGGTAYLFFDSLTSWRVATNPNGDDATTLTGLVDGKGGFMLAGTDALSGTQILVSGKVVFEKGSFTPKKISGKLSAVSTDMGHYGTGSFKAVPAAM